MSLLGYIDIPEAVFPTSALPCQNVCSDSTTHIQESSTPISHMDKRNTKTYIKSYQENFSIHGLAKIFGGAIFERVFWFLTLAGCLGFVAVKCNGFYMEYIQYDVRTEVRIKSDDNITLPALTICKSIKLMGQHHKGFVNEVKCYKNKSVYEFEDYIDCKNPRTVTKVTPMEIKALVGRSKPYPHFQYHPDFPSCSTINVNGTITSQSNSAANSFLIQWPQNIYGSMTLYLYLHDQEDLPFLTGDFLSKQLVIIEPGYYILGTWDKTVTLRKQHPFPSNCTYGENNESIFPGPYTFKKCQETCLFRKMLDDCGAVLDHWQRYAHGKYSTNKTSNNTRNCLHTVLMSTLQNCNCPFSCNETSFDAGFKVINWKEHSDMVEIQMIYNKNTFTMIEEYEAYPKDKFVTDIGGWCGLFSGMSFLSIVEILVFAVLSLIAFFEKFRK